MDNLRRNVTIAAILAAILPGSATAAWKNYSPAKVIAAMKRPDPKLKIIIAHRGAYGSQCPENSLCAIDKAPADRFPFQNQILR